jgi:hypothetical protein
MHSFSRKKILLIGFIIILLFAIPLTIFLIKQQQEIRSRAQAASKLSFEPASTQAKPILVNRSTDSTVNLDVIVDPNDTNLVSFVKLEILYDATKLATGGATPQEKPFVEDTTALTLLEGPVYSPGKIEATLSVGVDPTKVIQTRTKIATLTFTAIATTQETPTQVTFGPATEVLSTSTGDQASENVLASTEPAYIAISEEGGTTTPTPSQTPAVSLTPSPTPTFIENATPTPTIPSTATTPTPEGGTGTSVNQSPVCSALELDRSSTGTAPYAVTLTARGTDSDGTISKVTFSFGDGEVTDVTQGGGIGTSSVNAAISHTYQNPGSYTASALITDNDGDVNTSTCSQVINVTSATGGGTSDTTPAPTSSAQLPATGPGGVLLGIGTIIGMLSVIGAIIFFVL